MTDLRLLAWCVLCGAVVVAGGLGLVAAAVRSLSTRWEPKR